MTNPVSETVAKVLVFNEKSEVLILTLGEHKERPEKSFKPDLPGGLVDPGETELAAVARELQEETGITAALPSFRLAYARTEFLFYVCTSVTKFLYLLALDASPALTLSWEHSGYKWVALADLMAAIDLRSFYKEAIEYCFAHKLLQESNIKS